MTSPWTCGLIVTLSAVLVGSSGREPWAGGTRLEWEELARRTRAARVVYVGEGHGRPEHHLLQRDLLAVLADAGPAVLACEYFPRSLQPVLDRFNAGALSLEELPAALDWDRTWGHPWPAYAPLFQLCRERGIPVVALNVERVLTDRVRREGLAALPLPELLALPRVELGVTAHRQRVEARLQAVHPLPPEALARYYEAFTLWDEAMAEGVCDLLLRDRRPNLRVLVVAGAAHIETGTGVPDRVTRRAPLPRLVVVADSEGAAEAADADVVVRFAPAGAWY